MKPTLKEKLDGSLSFYGYWFFDPRSGIAGGCIGGALILFIALVALGIHVALQ